LRNVYTVITKQSFTNILRIKEGKP